MLATNIASPIPIIPNIIPNDSPALPKIDAVNNHVKQNTKGKLIIKNPITVIVAMIFPAAESDPDLDGLALI